MYLFRLKFLTLNIEKTIPYSDWKIVTIGDIGIVIGGGTPSTKEPEYWGGDIPWITPADLASYKGIYIGHGLRNITEIGLDNSSAKLLPQNSILFSTRAPIGYVAIAKNELATNQGFKSIAVPNIVNPKFVYFYFLTIKGLAESLASGTTFLELSTTKFKQIPFPITVPRKQDMIVSKIEEIFSELDKNILLLNETLRKVDHFERKILEKYIVKPAVKSVRLSDVSVFIQYGHGTKSYKSSNKGNYRYLRITDIQDGKINWSKVPYCSVDSETFEKYALKDEDILFARSGNTVGKTLLVLNSHNTIYASYLIRIRCDNSKILPKYLSYFMLSDDYWNQINSGISGIGQPNFNGTKLRNLRVPFLPIDQQRDAVDNVDINLAIAARVRSEINLSYKKIERLKSKILSDAFSGHLSRNIQADQTIDEYNIALKDNVTKLTKIVNSKLIRKVKIKNTEIDLIKVISDNFQGEGFSYSQIFNLVKISRDSLNKKFTELENKKLLENYFDEQTETVKYRLA